MRRPRRPGDIPALASLGEESDRAIEALEPGMGAREIGGDAGFIEEIVPESGDVYLATGHGGKRVPARRVRPTDPDERKRFEDQTGITERRESYNDLLDKYGVDL